MLKTIAILLTVALGAETTALVVDHRRLTAQVKDLTTKLDAADETCDAQLEGVVGLCVGEIKKLRMEIELCVDACKPSK